LHAWGRAFLAGLALDPDRLVADVALLELAMTAPVAQRPDLPEPWVWDRDPWQVAAAIAAGHDPVDVPHAEAPVLVYREPSGRLATALA